MSTTMAEAADALTAGPARRLSRFVGNVFLGMSVGLLGYYGATNLMTRVEQVSLRAESPAAIYRERVAAAGPTLDFRRWRSEDAAYWSALRQGKPFGRITAPRMDLDAVIVKGVGRADLRRGPGWIDYTDYPGPTGNCGVSGHRTTYGAPFRRLDRLRPGDMVRLFSPYRRYTYRVRRVFSVRPNRVDVVASTKEPRLTLTACDPPYSARMRLVVQCDLVEVKRLAE